MLETAVRFKPDIAENYYNLALIYLEKGMAEDAIRSLRQALELSPRSAEVHRTPGFLYNQGGINEKAIQHFQPGVVYDLQGNLKKAIAEHQQTIQLEPRHANAHTRLGIVYYKQRSYDQASSAFQKAIAIKPD